LLGESQFGPAKRRIALPIRAAWAAGEGVQVQRVDDVEAFPGHIACDAASASELVVPIVRDGELLAVLDLDSPTRARFDAEVEAGCLKLGEILAKAL
jgi:GAF domain-containing protein